MIKVPHHYFIFNGRCSLDFGVKISGNGTFSAPERDVTKVEIPGRNGNLHIDNGRFKNRSVVFDAYLTEDFENNIDAFRNFMLNSRGYLPLENSYHPDEYLLASYNGPFEPDVHAVSSGSFKLEFDCKPQRFLKSGTHAEVISSGDTIFNPTHFDSCPLIRIYGNGVLTIGTQTVTVAGNTEEYVDIDSEIMDCFCGSTNLNSKVILNGHEFPVLKEGPNMITFTDISSVVITPRWWKI